MSSNVLTMMIGISTFLGLLGLAALLWGLKSGQFNDRERFLGGALRDSEDDLKDAVILEKRREEAKKRKKEYRPPD